MFRKSWTSPISIYRLQGNWDQYDEGHLCGKLTIRRDRSKRRQQERRKYDMAAILFWWFVSQYLNISIPQYLNLSIFQYLNLSIYQFLKRRQEERRRLNKTAILSWCFVSQYRWLQLKLFSVTWKWFVTQPVFKLNLDHVLFCISNSKRLAATKGSIFLSCLQKLYSIANSKRIDFTLLLQIVLGTLPKKKRDFLGIFPKGVFSIPKTFAN